MNHNNNNIIALVNKTSGNIVWTYENHFYDTLYSVRIWDNEICVGGGYAAKFSKNCFITLAEFREQQIKTILDG
jgi:hypothetical protein